MLPKTEAQFPLWTATDSLCRRYKKMENKINAKQLYTNFKYKERTTKLELLLFTDIQKVVTSTV